MAVQKLTNGALLKLKNELTTLLQQDLNGLTRYKLLTLQNSVTKKLDAALKLQDELIKKYGEQTPMGIAVHPFKKLDDGTEVPNEKFQSFVEDFEPVLAQEEELIYKELPASIFENLITTKNIELIFSFVEEEE